MNRGTKIGRFVVVGELGRGGMGAVYSAHDPQLDRHVALKVLRDASGGAVGTGSDEEDRLRMLREGQAMARVTHPNVITVYEVGTEGGIVFLAQELLDGGTLRGWLESGRHSQREILEKFVAAGRGLMAAHAAGLVHRDFKPENVLLGKDGRVRVADFGLARAETTLSDALAVTAKGGGPVRTDDASPMSQLTRTGAVMGTPMFMAPEQHRGERADARSDQFAFCVSLYHALYGAWPYEGKTAVALADAVIEGRLAPVPKDAAVSPRLRKTLLRGLSTIPAERYPGMEGLLADLERELAPEKSGRTGLVVGSVLVLAAAGAGAFYYLQMRDKGEVRAPAPLPVVTDADGLTTEKGIAWWMAAIDRGQLADAIEKYDLAATVKIQANRPTDAAIAEAAGAYMRVLRGDVDGANAKIVLATGHAGTEPTAMAYVDLAEASLAYARGQLPAARDRSKRCAEQLASQPTTTALASVCREIHGDALAALGDETSARAAYEAGLSGATPEQASELQLALAAIDDDRERATVTASSVESVCERRGAIGCQVRARILMARSKLDAADQQGALELLTGVNPATIETFGTRVAHAIALGEVQGYMHEAGEDDIEGLDRIDKAREEANGKGLALLVLEAKLARLRVMYTSDPDHAPAAYADVVKQARALKAERFVHLADTAKQDYAGSGSDQGMLPADGGVPAMRSGSSGEPGVP